jgi:fucose permease
MGAGMATLQVLINPLLRVAGGEEHFAFNSAFAQLIFGLASFISPRVYSYLVENLGRAGEHGGLVGLLARITPAKLPWVSIYWIFAASSIAMMAVSWASRFPSVERTEEERVGTVDMYRKLLRNPVVWLFFGCIFAYVGSEQGTADWISRFLSQYHGFDPHTTGAAAVSWFWGLMTAGCFIGMGLLKLFDSRRVLIAFASLALVCLTVALFSSGRVSLVAFPMMGLFASIMWPVLMSLALNSVAEFHGSFAGILCTGVVGGAVVPLIIGRLGDVFGLRTGMGFLYLTFGCVLSVGFWAKPLITNVTIRAKKTAAESAS